MTPNVTALSFALTSTVNPTQAGGLLSFSSSTVLARFGVSFKSADQACANAEAEVPTWDWNTVQKASRDQWEDVLQRVQVDTSEEDATIVELLYSSVGQVYSTKR